MDVDKPDVGQVVEWPSPFDDEQGQMHRDAGRLLAAGDARFTQLVNEAESMLGVKEIAA